MSVTEYTDLSRLDKTFMVKCWGYVQRFHSLRKKDAGLKQSLLTFIIIILSIGAAIINKISLVVALDVKKKTVHNKRMKCNADDDDSEHQAPSDFYGTTSNASVLISYSHKLQNESCVDWYRDGGLGSAWFPGILSTYVRLNNNNSRGATSNHLS